MTESKGDTESTWIDPDDAPELTDEWFEKASLMLGEVVIRPGRPAGSAKQQVTLRLDRDILARFRAAGPGWQTRINEALRKAV